MIDFKIAQTKGNNAIKHLREVKFQKGLPFMINSRELPSTQCYLEYPDKRMVLVGMRTTTDRDFTVIRELSVKETIGVRAKFDF